MERQQPLEELSSSASSSSKSALTPFIPTKEMVSGKDKIWDTPIYDLSDKVMPNTFFSPPPQPSKKGEKYSDNSMRPLELVKTNFIKATLSGSLFKNCRLTSAKFENAKLQGVKFENCVIYATKFNNARLEGADFFNESSVESCNFTGAHLEGAKFKGVISNGQFLEISLQRTIMTGAHLEGADLIDVIWDEAGVHSESYHSDEDDDDYNPPVRQPDQDDVDAIVNGVIIDEHTKITILVFDANGIINIPASNAAIRARYTSENYGVDLVEELRYGYFLQRFDWPYVRGLLNKQRALQGLPPIQDANIPQEAAPARVDAFQVHKEFAMMLKNRDSVMQLLSGNDEDHYYDFFSDAESSQHSESDERIEISDEFYTLFLNLLIRDTRNGAPIKGSKRKKGSENTFSDEEKDAFQRIIYHISNANVGEDLEYQNQPIDLTHEQVIIATIKFLRRRTLDFKKLYFELFIQESSTAYNGLACSSQAMSCIAGVLERFPLIIGRALPTVDLGKEANDVDTIERLRELIAEISNTSDLTDIIRDIAGKCQNAIEDKEEFTKCITDKYKAEYSPEAPLTSDIIEKINQIAEQAFNGYHLIGGKRRRTRKRNMVKRRVTKRNMRKNASKKHRHGAKRRTHKKKSTF